jgi:hypothetical protein
VKILSRHFLKIGGGPIGEKSLVLATIFSFKDIWQKGLKKGKAFQVLGAD